MNVTLRFFQAKPMKIIKIFFSVLNGINSMSGRKKGLQRRIRFYSPFNLFIN